MSVPVYKCVPSPSAGVITNNILDNLKSSGFEDVSFICKAELLEAAGVDLKKVSGVAAIGDSKTHVILHTVDYASLLSEALKAKDMSSKADQSQKEVEVLKAQLVAQACDMIALSRSVQDGLKEKERLELELKSCQDRLRACEEYKLLPGNSHSTAEKGQPQNFPAAQEATAHCLHEELKTIRTTQENFFTAEREARCADRAATKQHFEKLFAEMAEVHNDLFAVKEGLENYGIF